MDVAIDTSSLSTAIEDGSIDGLIRSVERRRVRLIISGEVLAECLNSAEDGARQRLQVVFRLADALGTRLVLADELGSIHRRERKQALSSTPTISGSSVMLAFLRDPSV